MRISSTIAILGFLAMMGCGKTTPTPMATEELPASTIWSVATFEVYPHQGADYVQFLDENWVVARDSALKTGFVVDWEVWIEEPLPADSAANWNLVMLTAYRDSVAYAEREALFGPILDALGEPEPVKGKGPRQMARFLEEHPMKKVIARQ